MKIRSDSPFAKLDEEERELILEIAPSMNLEDLAEHVQNLFTVDKPVTAPAMKRFLRRLRLDQALKDAEEAEEETQLLAQRGKDSRTREAALEAARVKMCELAVKTEDRETLAVMLKTLSEEKAREHELVMRERQLAVAEEHAKVAWRKLEVEVARGQLKLLPKALEILGDESLGDAVKIAAVRRCLMEAGAAAGLTAGLTAGGTAAGGDGERTAIAFGSSEKAANGFEASGVEKGG